MTHPLDDLPLQLTPQALREKNRWLRKISEMKGKERLDNIRIFVDRYHEAPHIPESDNPN